MCVGTNIKEVKKMKPFLYMYTVTHIFVFKISRESKIITYYKYTRTRASVSTFGRLVHYNCPPNSFAVCLTMLCIKNKYASTPKNFQRCRLKYKS